MGFNMCCQKGRVAVEILSIISNVGALGQVGPALTLGYRTGGRDDCYYVIRVGCHLSMLKSSRPY